MKQYKGLHSKPLGGSLDPEIKKSLKVSDCCEAEPFKHDK